MRLTLILSSTLTLVNLDDFSLVSFVITIKIDNFYLVILVPQAAMDTGLPMRMTGILLAEHFLLHLLGEKVDRIH